jgi:hypothetical protein
MGRIQFLFPCRLPAIASTAAIASDAAIDMRAQSVHIFFKQRESPGLSVFQRFHRLQGVGRMGK